ncbi:hypothetical protein [Frigoribacterium sp. NPDC087798]|uniref:hypothetical protein n=1 Tax=Frigoribacterium sp. NPDC087798 TaxID=3363993 RepID=UPI00381FF19F
MDLVSILSVVTVFIGLGAIVVPVVIFRRQSPKRSLTYEGMWRPMVVLRSSRLSVFYDGKMVLDPHFSTFVIESKSRADISSASFDGGDDITFDTKLEILAGSFQTEGDIEVRETPRGFAVPAQLITKGSAVRISFLTEGKPSPPLAVRSSLIDIDVVRLTPASEVRKTRRSRFTFVLSFYLAIISIVVAVASFISLINSSR